MLKLARLCLLGQLGIACSELISVMIRFAFSIIFRKCAIILQAVPALALYDVQHTICLQRRIWRKIARYVMCKISDVSLFSAGTKILRSLIEQLVFRPRSELPALPAQCFSQHNQALICHKMLYPSINSHYLTF